jgi:hypothetical protein
MNEFQMVPHLLLSFRINLQALHVPHHDHQLGPVLVSRVSSPKNNLNDIITDIPKHNKAEAKHEDCIKRFLWIIWRNIPVAYRAYSVNSPVKRVKILNGPGKADYRGIGGGRFEPAD